MLRETKKIVAPIKRLMPMVVLRVFLRPGEALNEIHQIPAAALTQLAIPRRHRPAPVGDLPGKIAVGMLAGHGRQVGGPGLQGGAGRSHVCAGSATTKTHSRASGGY
jgi:hypothetical protein